MSELASSFSSGMGPRGSAASFSEPAPELADDVGAEVTAVVSTAAGGVQFWVVTMLAVAVSFTELTEVAPDPTATCACSSAGCFTDTELIVHSAVPSPLVQPLVNTGFRLVGWAVSATDTFEADVFSVETFTV
jgi:hypothetical protein